jgi:flagellar basal body-associated protein FliL
LKLKTIVIIISASLNILFIAGIIIFFAYFNKPAPDTQLVLDMKKQLETNKIKMTDYEITIEQLKKETSITKIEYVKLNDNEKADFTFNLQDKYNQLKIDFGNMYADYSDTNDLLLKAKKELERMRFNKHSLSLFILAGIDSDILLSSSTNIQGIDIYVNAVYTRYFMTGRFRPYLQVGGGVKVYSEIGANVLFGGGATF